MDTSSLTSEQKSMLSTEQRRLTLPPAAIDALAERVLQYAISIDAGLASRPVELPAGSTLGDALLVLEAAAQAIEAALDKRPISHDEYNAYFCLPAKSEFASRDFPYNGFALLAEPGEAFVATPDWQPRQPFEANTRILFLNRHDWECHIESARTRAATSSRVNASPSAISSRKL